MAGDGVTKRVFRDDALSYRSTLIVRFVMIATILVYHAGQYFQFSFPDCGHLCVAFFFFMSGYGLELSSDTKSGYMRDFLQRRVLGLMMQYWLILMVIAVVVMVMQFDWNLLHSNVSNAFLRNPWWYITELLVLYVIYYIGMMMSTRLRRLAWVVIADCIMMLMMTEYFGMDVYLKSGLCFIAGMIWYMYRGPLSAGIRRWYPAVLVVAVVLTIPSVRYQEFDPLDMVLCGITCLSMVVVYICLASIDVRRTFPVHLTVAFLGLFMTWYTMENGMRSEGSLLLFVMAVSSVLVQCGRVVEPLVFLGAASLEMYLMQFMFFQVPDLDAALPDWQATLLAFCLMLAVSLPTHQLVKRVMARYQQGVARLESLS